LLLLTGLAVSQLAAQARRLKVITVTDAGYLAQIYETASLAKSARVPDVVVDRVKEQLVGLLDLQGARFEYGSLLGHPPRLEPDGTVTVGRYRWDVELSGLPAEEVELRTFGNGQYYGRFMLKAKPGSKPPLQARLVAVTLADQAGRAFGASQAARSASLRTRRSRASACRTRASVAPESGFRVVMTQRGTGAMTCTMASPMETFCPPQPCSAQASVPVIVMVIRNRRGSGTCR
jgi:hypothetical protein